MVPCGLSLITARSQVKNKIVGLLIVKRNYVTLSITNNICNSPFKEYLDLRDKKTIFRENRGKSGIYRFVNILNGRSYVGSSVDLTRRFRDYLSSEWLNKELLKNKSFIYKALLKNGYSNFRLEILEYCDKADCVSREQYYMDTLRPFYNICSKAGSSLGRLTTNATRLKLRRVGG